MNEDYERTCNIFDVQKIFGMDIHKNTLLNAETKGLIPKAEREQMGKSRRTQRVWPISDIPKIGERYGFLKKLTQPLAIAIYTTKGGVLKTTLAVNIARVFALHNIKVCVVGLDMQMDISNILLGIFDDDDDDADLVDLTEKMSHIASLSDLIDGKKPIEHIIQKTDIPTLDIIPECPELNSLADQLDKTRRKEYWIKENVVEPLKKKYDLVILDCSPNWNNLVTNALTASDMLVSPIECKINHYNNFPYFKAHLQKFFRDMDLDIPCLFVPTKYSNKKLAREIKHHYAKNIENCSNAAIRESAFGEESMVARVSFQEHDGRKIQSEEMRDFLIDLNTRLIEVCNRKGAH